MVYVDLLVKIFKCHFSTASTVAPSVDVTGQRHLLYIARFLQSIKEFFSCYSPCSVRIITCEISALA